MLAPGLLFSLCPGTARRFLRAASERVGRRYSGTLGLALLPLTLTGLGLSSAGLCAGLKTGVPVIKSTLQTKSQAVLTFNTPATSTLSGAALMPNLGALSTPLPLPTPPVSPTGVSPTGAKAAALLPGPGQMAQVMKLGSQLATVDLQTRVLRAGGSREALQSVLTSVAKGQMPAYDERLGISRAEFGKYLAFQPVLLGAGKNVRLNLSRDATRFTFGDSGGVASVLRGLSFDLKTGDLRVPEGFSFKAQTVLPSNAPDRTVDIRGGLQWNLRGYNADTQNGLNGQLSLFQLGNGQTLLVYKRTSMIHGAVSEGEVMLSYGKQ